MKRLVISMMLAACLFMAVSPFQALAAEKEVSVVIDGETVDFKDVDPYIAQDRVLVPVRGVFENLGLEITWNAETETATLVKDDVTMEMTIDATSVLVNGEVVQIDAPLSVENARMFVPLSFVMENVGADVAWDHENKVVTITTGETSNELDAEAKELLAKISEVPMDSFSADMKLDQTMTMFGEEISMNMDIQMDSVLDPFGTHQALTLSMKELGEDLSLETYMTEDGYYEYDSTTDQWITYGEELTGDLSELSDLSNYQLDPAAQLELMERFYEDVKVVENEDTYELYISVSGDGFKDLLNEILSMPELGLGQELEGMEEALEQLNIQINKLEIVTVYDKETLYPVSDKMETDMVISMEGEEISIVQNMENTYSNVNAIDEITIPQEVIDSAVPFEEVYGDLEDFELDPAM
ncbi:copper amine oxidase N-terminal domain-containing protein [Gracilibacillus oryzae]|uniref:Copper amine oxidase N-terminal domain-containing protein n=1 Tax=Gracilibacillus oryzae TaxID=1672701 RepID=A0A7C8L5T6_9BACI|nr:DUF6612 family protein [Gracilibacillus oryzae]KAB8129189.1 copper amine oxidase N-terminal domain-containing protein [Gracilibacillus oryzae]